MEIVAQGDVANLVLVHAPSFVSLNAPFVDQAHGFMAKEMLCAGKARGNLARAVRVRPLFHPGPGQKFLRRISELADHNPLRPAAFQQGPPMIRFDVLRLGRVLFCGDQVGRSAVLLSVQLEAVVPYPSAIPQWHSSSPEFGPASSVQHGPSDTKRACPPSSTLAPSPAISSRQALPVRGRDYAPALPEKANSPSGP